MRCWQYKQTPGSAECQACAALETTTGVASVSIDACVCAAGVGLFNGFCTTCASGTFKQQPGDQACGGACPAFSSSPAGSSNLTDCRCDPGYSGPDGGTCVECAAGTYKVASGSTACTPARRTLGTSRRHRQATCVCVTRGSLAKRARRAMRASTRRRRAQTRARRVQRAQSRWQAVTALMTACVLPATN